MAQEQKPDSGFALPAPVSGSGTAEVVPPASTTAIASVPAAADSVVNNVVNNTASRDLLVGGAVLLILFVAFFFAKNAYANGLVSKRLPPDKANASGWWLFIFLASLATGVVLAVVNASTFMAPVVIGPVVLVAVVALALTFISSRN